VEAGGTLKGAGGTSSILTVDEGATLAPGDSLGTFTAGSAVVAGTLAIETDAATTDRLTVNGDLTISGATLVITQVSAPVEGSHVIASYNGELTGTFIVTGLPQGYAVNYDSVAQEIRLEPSLVDGFGAFAEANNLTGMPDADFDNDGLPDAVEYVLGTSPTSPNAGGPAAKVAGGNLVFTFERERQSITPDISLAIQVSSNFIAWPMIYSVGPDTGSSSDGIVVTNNGTTDTITLTIAMGEDEKKFARLAVTVSP